VIVGIGGGSSMDIAKAISVLLTNEGKAQEYQGWDLVKNPPVYKIGIPTIAGTGAEFTRTAVLTGPTKKLGINSDYSVFDQVILDADLLKTVPKEQFIYTAMDCFVHNEESLLGRINDAMTIALAEKSLDIMKDIFLGEMDHEKLLIASSLGGLAVANSSVGICHPLSYGLSLELGLPHGFAICVAFNQLEEYYPNVKVFKEILKKYDIVLPKVINSEITEAQLDFMADATLLNEKPLSNAFGDNWKSIFTKEKVKDLLRKM
jgi:3-deoxy-alpha-D-manno-octulosonate 8-oxidase